MDAVGDEDLHFDLAVGGAELYVAAVLNAALLSQLVRDLDEGAWGHSLDPSGPVSHASLFEVFEEATVVEMEIELGSGFFGWFDPFDGMKLCLAVVEGEFVFEEEGSISAVFGNGPLEGAIAF